MNIRQNTMAILNYENFDKMPVVHFGYWGETLGKWVAEGKITKDEANEWACSKKLGFDYGWNASAGSNGALCPGFPEKVIEETPDGFVVVQNGSGLITRYKRGISSIPGMYGTLLKDRKSWEELYLPKLQPGAHRCDVAGIRNRKAEFDAVTDYPVGVHVGSLYGTIRDMLGVDNLAYLQVDDEDLYIEIIDTIGNICYENAKLVISAGVKFDFIHFWEDICFKNGPLVNPAVFKEYVCPHYKRITDLFRENGTTIASLDCDGCIDKLVPLWVESGVNTMFPIEVGTWEASIKPWREQLGKAVRGVGGMDKRVFAYDYKAVDAEIERLKPLIELGGYIPCPDHRIAPDAIYENVQYYVDRMQNLKI